MNPCRPTSDRTANLVVRFNFYLILDSLRFYEDARELLRLFPRILIDFPIDQNNLLKLVLAVLPLEFDATSEDCNSASREYVTPHGSINGQGHDSYSGQDSIVFHISKNLADF